MTGQRLVAMPRKSEFGLPHAGSTAYKRAPAKGGARNRRQIAPRTCPQNWGGRDRPKFFERKGQNVTSRETGQTYNPL
jgi:hypothetical protein